MEAIGYPPQILYNAAQAFPDDHLTDFDVVVIKLFSCASICIVQTERLRDFCDFVGIQ